MSVFRRRTRELTDEVLELRAALVAIREQAQTARVEGQSLRVRVAFVENLLDEQQRAIASTQERISSHPIAQHAPSRPLAPPDPGSSIAYLRSVTETALRSAGAQAAAVDRLRASQDQIDARLAEVATELARHLADHPTFEPTRPVPEPENLAPRFDGLAVQLDRLQAQLGTLSDRLLHLDQRIAAVETAQVRLANEQARYDISLRSELATVADELRGTGASAPRPDRSYHPS